ncbi:ATP-binding protein [Nisaea acidiphila]|uniref:histidine kinase n=1 Tax=Nisaea acidiphila TaxID=1862145 RepID=A0A9J7ATR0_9PROT|nr:PAS domain-containing hybrid sensor histidine kinase/response regulator [Nisaea acidiphila]UUX51083.1 ATP-binding protein [Nisaea acidiphila]
MAISLQTAVLGAMLGTFLLAAVLTYLRIVSNAAPGIGYWAAGFWIQIVTYACMIFVRSPLNAVLGDILQAAAAMLMLAGAWVFAGLNIRPPVVVVGTCLVAFWVLFAAIVDLGFVARTLPVYLLAGSVLLFAGVLLWRVAPHGAAGFWHKVVAVAFALWGLHRFDYPFLRPVEWFAPYGFIIAEVLAIAVAIGLILVAQHRLMERAEAEGAARSHADEALRKQLAIQQSIIDAISIPIVLEDLAGKIISANRAFAELVNRAADNIVGHEIGDVLSDPAAARVFAVDKDFVLRGRPEILDLRMAGPAGAKREFVVSKVPLLIEGTDRPGVVGVMQDLTDRKRVERQLFESEKRFRDFAEASSDWLWETDTEGRFTYFAHGSRDYSGLVPESNLGKSRFEATIEDLTSEKWRKHIADIEARRPFSGFRYLLRGDGGHEVAVVINGIPVFDNDGEFVGYRGTGSDVTQQREAEISRDRARLDAERANRAKSEFLATMSHEFRTPLNAILGFSEMLSKEVLGSLGQDTYREYAEAINDSGAHMLALVNDILDIAAIEAGKRTLNKEEIDLLELMKDCTVEVSPIAADKSINLEVGVPGAQLTAYADERSLHQIILNLLSNSVKFTPEGGWIRLVAQPDRGDMIAISVEDSGEGIPPEKLPTITDPFAQASSHPHHSREGTGLGLSIVKSLVEAHGGELKIESTLGVGTKVTVWLQAALGEGLPQDPLELAGPKAVLEEDLGGSS